MDQILLFLRKKKLNTYRPCTHRVDLGQRRGSNDQVREARSAEEFGLAKIHLGVDRFSQSEAGSPL